MAIERKALLDCIEELEDQREEISQLPQEEVTEVIKRTEKVLQHTIDFVYQILDGEEYSKGVYHG